MSVLLLPKVDMGSRNEFDDISNIKRLRSKSLMYDPIDGKGNTNCMSSTSDDGIYLIDHFSPKGNPCVRDKCTTREIKQVEVNSSNKKNGGNLLGTITQHETTSGCNLLSQHKSNVSADTSYPKLLNEGQAKAFAKNANDLNDLIHLTNTQSKKIESDIESVNEKLMNLEEWFQAIESSLPKQMLTKQVGSIHSNMTHENLDSRISTCNKAFSTLDLKIQLFENSNHSGRILWKIDNLKHRIHQAITGKITALHTAPCYTKLYGYKFCARLYLNGDGIGKRTHVSLFFVLMKSNHDNVLDWPFIKKINFALLNQDDSEKSIRESFTTDCYSSSFQKPTRDMNVAAGCPMFVTKDELLSRGFIKDDAIFIEITVTENKK